MLDLDLFADIAYPDEELIDGLTKEQINQTIENNKALVEQPRVKTKKQEFQKACNHGVNNRTVDDDAKFFSDKQVEKITWYRGAHHQKVLVDDGIPEYRLEVYRGYQIQICNHKDNGVPFQQNHCLIACVKWRNTGVTNIWQNLGVIQQNKNNILIFKSLEISKLEPCDQSIILAMLRFKFGLIPNQAIADNCLLRLGDNPTNYSVFSLDEMQRYLGVKLEVNDSPCKPYRVLSDNRVNTAVKEQPKPSVQFKIMSSSDMRKALKIEQKKRLEAEQRAKRYKLEAEERRDRMRMMEFKESPVIKDCRVHKRTEIR